LRGGNMIEELGLHPGTAGYRGLELLNVINVEYIIYYL